jgi:hypothetical protein
MKELLQKIIELGSNPSQSALYLLLNNIDLSKLNYHKHLDLSFKGAYNRIHLLNSPAEVILMYWPAKAESAIHQHNEFWGYVKNLEGSLTERTFEFDDTVLKYTGTTNYMVGSVLFEKENAVHQIINSSKVNALVTLNIYYPPHRNLEGTKIFDTKNKTIAVLNNHATSVSWENPAENFKDVIQNAFDYEE